MQLIAGVVGWVDMESENAPERIRCLAKNPYFKGIRPSESRIWMTPDWMRPARTRHALCNTCDLNWI